jgi:hypothetical protein
MVASKQDDVDVPIYRPFRGLLELFKIVSTIFDPFGGHFISYALVVPKGRHIGSRIFRPNIFLLRYFFSKIRIIFH